MDPALRPIQLLAPELVHRIAAGEIVDRPASALKELIENSLDAGSKHLRVTLVSGGLELMQVEDDGCGFSQADLRVCGQRHATSKITTLDDLEAIFTLGFRGEALSAVASVSRLQIETSRPGDGSWKLEILGGQRQELQPAPPRRGTRLSVRNLFFNIPARLKFLKRPATEARECVEVLENLALANPEVAFEWHLLDGQGEVRAQRQLPAQSLRDRFLALKGPGFETFEVEKLKASTGIEKIQVIGLRPPAAENAARAVSLCVNGRCVTDKRLPYALRDAFAGLIEVGSYPVVWVRLEVDPSLIDVNIHPQKKELRWPVGFSLAGLVYSLVRPLFEVKLTPAPAVEPTSFSFAAPEPQPLTALPSSALPEPPPPLRLVSSTPLMPLQRPSFRFRDLRVVGEVGAAWIVAEAPSGLILVDQHAAHERVSYERILCQRELLPPRPLLLPLKLPLPLGVEAKDPWLREALESLGFELVDDELLTKDAEIEIIAIPQTERKIDWEKILTQMFNELARGERPREMATDLRSRLASSLACHGSVRRGQRLAREEIEELFRQLDEVEWGAFCPHGRPVWFSLSHEQIEGFFHR